MGTPVIARADALPEKETARTGARRRILFLTIASEFGGMERHTLNLANELVGRGYEITIVQLGHDVYERADRGSVRDGVQFSKVGLSHDLSQAGILDCWRLLMQWRGADCIFPKGWFPAGSLTFDLLARMTFRRYLTIEHLQAEPLPARPKVKRLKGLMPAPGVWWYRKRIAARLRSFGPHHTICVSEAVKRALAEIHKFPETKMTAVVNGIDVECYKFDEGHRATVRRRMNLPAEAFLFGFIGRVNPVKGIELAINCIHDLRAMGKEAYLLIVGDGPCLEALRSQAGRMGLSDAVLFLEFTKRPWEIYPALDSAALPSRNEGLPLFLLEAMACQCPPISTDVGGVPELISAPYYGWLVPQGKPDAFLNAMREAMEVGPTVLREMGMQARQHVVSHFNARTQMALLVDVIEQQIGGAHLS